MKKIHSIWLPIKSRFKSWIDLLLQHTHNHYLCYLPGGTKSLLRLLLRMLYARVRIDPDSEKILKPLKDQGVVVYVNRYRSMFEFLFYHNRYQREKLPFPELGFDYKPWVWQPVWRLVQILVAKVDYFFHHRSLPDRYASGYIREELRNGHCGYLSLVEERGYYRRYVRAKTDPIRYLIAMQTQNEQPIFLVPQLMVYSRNPQRSRSSLVDILFGTEDRPGRLRRLFMILKSPGKVFVEISEPLNLKTFLERPEIREMAIPRQTLVVRQHLLDQLNRHRQSITGPMLKSSLEIKENMLTDERMQAFMRRHAETENIPLHEVYRKAEQYLEEIAAKLSMAMIAMYSASLTWIINTMFDGFTFNRNELKNVKTAAQKGPVIFIPCHKSHIDYLILSFVLYHNDMPVPLIAAGKNLSFWPMGPIFRGGGAFFLRRTFKGKKLYATVFSEYVRKILEEGYNIEFFIEGTRSRTGKLMRPKLGFLSMLLDAYDQGACEDMNFVPISIGYDRVLEEGAYIKELEGGQKQTENLKGVIRARKFLKKRYGKIYLMFHEPISIKDLAARQPIAYEQMTATERHAFAQDLGYRVLNAIDKVTVVTPHALAAAAILNFPKKRFTLADIVQLSEFYMNYLLNQNIRISDTLVVDHIHAVEHVVESYAQQKFIERADREKDAQGKETEYKTVENRRPVLEYYKNNCASHFIPPAYTAMAILANDAFQFSSQDLHDIFGFLQSLFKYEFTYNMDLSSEFFLRKSIKTFIDEAIVMPHPTLPDRYNLTAEGYRKLKLYAGFLRSYLESYLIVLNHFMRCPPKELDPKERMKKVQSMGQRMYRRKEIRLREALSRVTYKNAVDYFMKRGIVCSDDEEKIDYYLEKIQKYIDFLDA